MALFFALDDGGEGALHAFKDCRTALSYVKDNKNSVYVEPTNFVHVTAVPGSTVFVVVKGESGCINAIMVRSVTMTRTRVVVLF
jgi:hypothetical protein